jgi:hypothetical protein
MRTARALGRATGAASRSILGKSARGSPAVPCAPAGISARFLSAGAGDPWAAAVRSAPAHTAGGGGILLLVEKAASASDVSLGDPLKLPRGGLEGWGTPVHAQTALRLTLLDKRTFDLEAPFLRKAAGGDVVASSIGLEDIFLSPALSRVMQASKPHVVGALGMDMTDTRVFLAGGGFHRPDAPFVRILELTTNISGDAVVKVCRTNDNGDALAVLRDPANILTCNLVTSELHLDTPLDAVKESIQWIWPHGHIQPDDIKLEWLDTTPMPDSEANGGVLLHGKVDDPTTPFCFSKSTFVPGECQLTIQGVRVQILVNKKDVIARATPRKSEGGKQAASSLFPVAVVMGAGMLAFVIYSRQSTNELPATPQIPPPNPVVKAPPPPPPPPPTRPAPPPPSKHPDEMGMVYDICILTLGWYYFFFINGMV